jgi:hypothetical protein
MVPSGCPVRDVTTTPLVSTRLVVNVPEPLESTTLYVMDWPEVMTELLGVNEVAVGAA